MKKRSFFKILGIILACCAVAYYGLVFLLVQGVD